MLNKEELRKQVIQYFRSVGSGENIVQCIKEALFLHQKFSPVMIFEILSRGKQKITGNDIRNYLVNHNIMFSEDQFRYYIHQNNFKQEITLNEFLEAMIPFNADVVREYKQKYLESLQIKEFDPQVQFILSELFDNELKFYRSLINIREDITKIATKKQIQALVKQDLILQSKPREARKFHQNFQNKNFQLGFHQLRKFLQIWLSSKQIIHEFYLLNVMRHLKSNSPFQRIVFKNKRIRSKSASNNTAQQRSYSAKQRIPQGLTNQKIKEQLSKIEQPRYEGKTNFLNKEDKYANYKNDVINQFHKQRSNISDNKNTSPSKSRRAQPKHEQIVQDQALRRSKYERQSKGIDATILLQILEEIVIKEERLQKLRKNLAKCEDFNLINLNKLLDVRNKGYINSKDFADFTGIGRVQYNYMTNFYAREQQKLRFHQFCLIFRPLSKQLNQLIDRRPQHKVPNPFKKETTKLILQVITLSADMHSNISHLKQKISHQGISLKNYFRFIDYQEKGYISAKCFQDVLTENNIFCDDKDLKCLMKLFKKKVDERINLQQFVDFLDL